MRFVKKHSLKRFMPESSFWKKIMLFAIPIAFQNMSTAILGIIDVSIISDMGEEAVASVSLANQLAYIASLFTFGITSGAQIYLSRAYGESNASSMKKTFSLMMFFAMAVNLVFMLVYLAFPKMSIGFFTNDNKLILNGASYIRIAAPLFVFYAISASFVSFFRSVGIPKIPMITTIVSLLVKVVLNLLLIYGCGFIPAMGICGAAIATLVSKIVEFVIYIFFALSYKEKRYIFSFKDIAFIKMEGCGEFIGKTYPVILNESLWGLGISSFSAVFGRMGERAVSAMSIAQQLENLGNAFFYGISIGCCVSISFMLGQNKFENARINVKKYALAAFYVGLGIMLLMCAIAYPYVNIFFSNLEKETKSLAVIMIVVYAIYMPWRSLASTLIMGAMRAGGDSKTGMLLDVLPIYLWSLPVGYILGIQLHCSVIFVLFAMQFKRFIKAALATNRLLSGKWLAYKEFSVKETVINN